MAEALYRKYRPQIFEDVVGQEPIERTLKNAIAQDKVSHAYLLTGPRGTGKTTTARLIAKALLCEHGPTPDPDGTCEDCKMIAESVHPDVYELDAASRTGVENVREEIISRVQFAPTRGRYKVYIIDEVHMLSQAAFNALLKTLEEPPAHVVFVLCTTDPQKVPETIHSRCQRFDFRRISPEAMVSRLGAICVSEGVEFDGDALDLIAHRAEGGMRNALTSLEQIIAFENGKVTLEGAERILGSIDSSDMADVIRAIGKRDVAACFRWVADYAETGADLAQFARDMAEHVRNMYVMALAGDDIELGIPETTRRELIDERQWFGEDRLARLLGVIGDLSAELKTSTNQRLSFEIALTRMVRPDSDLTLESIAERVEALESGYSAVAHVVADAPGSVAAAAAPVSAPPIHTTAPVAQDLAPAAAPDTAAASAQTALSGARAPQPAARPASPQTAPRPSVQAASQAATADHVAAAPQVAQTPNQTASVQAPSSISARLASSLENPAALQRIWQAALSALKKQKTAYGVLFLNAKAVFDQPNGRIVIEFPRENGFAYKSVQRADMQDSIAAALAQAAGEKIPYLFSLGHYASGGVATAAPRSTAPAAVQSAEVVPTFAKSAVSAAPVPAAAQVDHGMASEARPSYGSSSYDEVPYFDDDYVPYDDDAAFGMDAYDEPDYAPKPSSERDTSNAVSAADAAATDAVDASDIEAMLNAGFGGGVVFSEIDDGNM